jgi:hypothetical protein
MNWNLLLLPEKRTRNAFRNNFVSWHLKAPIITKKIDILLKNHIFARHCFIKIGPAKLLKKQISPLCLAANCTSML